MSFYPFVPHEISVLIELILGHLRYLLTDVPPQPNSPPDYVINTDHLGPPVLFFTFFKGKKEEKRAFVRLYSRKKGSALYEFLRIGRTPYSTLLIK